jgi:hypothetical protein
VSFFDEDDEPARTRTAPRSPRRGGAVRAGRPTSADSQTLLIRRAVALGGGVLILILAVVAIRGCLDARKENGLKDYNRELGSIIRQSDTQVAKPFFDLLDQGGRSAADLTSAIAGYRQTADDELKQARGLDVPGQMATAQESALVALELRANALDGIASRIRPALGDQGEQADQAIAGIAGQMQNFLASDVLWQGRVVPLVKKALDDAEIGGQTIANTNRSLQDLSWLSEATVADRLGQSISGDTGNGGSKTIAPGLHGSGLVSVAAGDVTLQPGAANRVPAGTQDFTVTFANQGENDEFDVGVVLRVTPTSGGKAIVARKSVNEIAQGAQAEVALTLPARPPTGEAVTIRAEVRKVPGEEKLDNNSQEYQALFEG